MIKWDDFTWDGNFESAKREVPTKGLGGTWKFVRLVGRKAAYPPYAMPNLQDKVKCQQPPQGRMGPWVLPHDIESNGRDACVKDGL